MCYKLLESDIFYDLEIGEEKILSPKTIIMQNIPGYMTLSYLSSKLRQPSKNKLVKMARLGVSWVH